MWKWCHKNIKLSQNNIILSTQILLLWPVLVAHLSYFPFCLTTGCRDKAGSSTFDRTLLTVAAAPIKIPLVPPEPMSPGTWRVTKLRRHTHASVVAAIQRAENKQLPDTRGAVNCISHFTGCFHSALLPGSRWSGSRLRHLESNRLNRFNNSAKAD